MGGIFNSLWYVIIVPIVFAILFGGYFLLCTPGLLVIRLIKQYGRPTKRYEALMKAGIRAIFMSPVPVFGHSFMILPYPFGLLAYKLKIGTEMSILLLIVPIPLTFLCSLAYSVFRKELLRSGDQKNQAK